MAYKRYPVNRFILTISAAIFLTFTSGGPAGGIASAQLTHQEANINFQLQPGDRLQIAIYREEDLSRMYEIDPMGNLTFPLLGEFRAAGLKVEELRESLILGLRKYLIDPQVTISREESSIKSISILGHVKAPGAFDYQPGMTLMRLISQAGGFAPSANKRKIRIVRTAEKGDKETIIVNGSEIIDGKSEDPEIHPGDMIFVPESIF